MDQHTNDAELEKHSQMVDENLFKRYQFISQHTARCQCVPKGSKAKKSCERCKGKGVEIPWPIYKQQSKHLTHKACIEMFQLMEQLKVIKDNFRNPQQWKLHKLVEPLLSGELKLEQVSAAFIAVFPDEDTRNSLGFYLEYDWAIVGERDKLAAMRLMKQHDIGFHRDDASNYFFPEEEHEFLMVVDIDAAAIREIQDEA